MALRPISETSLRLYNFFNPFGEGISVEAGRPGRNPRRLVFSCVGGRVIAG
jgi:hypothetical protein